MPELPDLNVFSRNLNKLFAGRKLNSVEIYYTKKLNASPEEIKNSLIEASLKEVKRDGKELRFIFNNETVIGLHLMLHGELQATEELNPNKKTIAAFIFETTAFFSFQILCIRQNLL